MLSNLVNEKICRKKWAQVGHFEFDRVEFFHGTYISPPETAHFLL